MLPCITVAMHNCSCTSESMLYKVVHCPCITVIYYSIQYNIVYTIHYRACSIQYTLYYHTIIDKIFRSTRNILLCLHINVKHTHNSSTRVGT